MSEENENLVLQILRNMQEQFGDFQVQLDTMNRRLEVIDIKVARLEVEAQAIKATISKHSVLFDAVLESIAQSRAATTVANVAVRHHDVELAEIRERLAKLEEKS